MTLAAASAMAAVTSENVVGYMNKDARGGLNWYAPMFAGIGTDMIDINDIVLDDGGQGIIGWGTEALQFVNEIGVASSMYIYNDPSMDPNGTATTYYWGDAEYNPVNITFAKGEGVGLDNAGGNTFSIRNAGEVAKSSFSFAAHAGLNWTGNPFPASIPIANIILDDGGLQIIGWGTEAVQIVNEIGVADAMYIYNDASMDPNASATGYYWGDAEYNPVEVTLNAGDGIGIDNAGGNEFTITIKCPYTL